MFKKRDRIAELNGKIKSLLDDRFELKQQVEDLKLKKKIEEEDIKHMVKIKEESLEIEHRKRNLELEREKDQEVAKVKDQYRDKMEAHLERQIGDIKEMYGEILKRLPEVRVRLKGDV